MSLIYSVSQELCINVYLAIGIVLRIEGTPKQTEESTYSFSVPTLLTLHYFSYLCENELHYH